MLGSIELPSQFSGKLALQHNGLGMLENRVLSNRLVDAALKEGSRLLLLSSDCVCGTTFAQCMRTFVGEPLADGDRLLGGAQKLLLAISRHARRLCRMRCKLMSQRRAQPWIAGADVGIANPGCFGDGNCLLKNIDGVSIASLIEILDALCQPDL